ncbi:hypothetical protein [Pseudomonas fluorescens]|uniref:Uncharacterized protein n=1 Tax=Pseudomonas fluorescens TaxID=294 RepID=A0A5E6XSH5_PSEFL|nr:hypothetical protein [Pseudomonas fluorescens]VVN42851.1 hypothetical protein PS659_05568 [Pseudomonas fluorescens]
MCTLTHFAYPLVPDTDTPASSPPVQLRHPESLPDVPTRPRFQVVMAGIAFFHIKDISTGYVRGFRANHNEACALARFLESRG